MTSTTDLLLALIRESSDADMEARIIELVASLSPEELNEFLSDANAQQLVDNVDNHVLGPDRRHDLLRLLVEQRGDQLDLPARAAVIRSMQVDRTTSEMEHWCADLICQVRGNDLTHLKNVLDLRKDGHNLEGLVYRDIDSDEVRDRILAHIAAEAAALDPEERPRREAKVLSDIDDTVFCKLHDKRYPKGTLYPGVLAFQEELDRGPVDDPLSLGDLTFVTARPRDVFGLIAGHSRKSLANAGIADMSLLSGSLFSLLSLDAMAGKKVENITHYNRLFPEYDMVFMGDSGQGDVKVGEKIWELYPDAVKAVFIHDVVDTSEDERAEYAGKKIWFHDTYVGAAAKARELGLISDEGLAHVISEAREGLAKVVWDSPEQEASMMALFERDEARANDAVSNVPLTNQPGANQPGSNQQVAHEA